MASSVGEAIGDGLERGLRLGMGIQDHKRQVRRQQERDALETEDRALRLQDRQDQLTRQREAEREAAIGAQLEDVNAELGTLGPADASTPRAKLLTERSERLRGERNRRLVTRGGYDFQAEEREAQADMEALRAGQGANLPPARRVRAIVAATGRNVAEFRRGPDGSPSPVAAAVDDFRAGLSGGDSARMLRGANKLLAPDLQRGIGEKSPHGGTIVGKEIVGFDPAPNGSPDDPQMIPRLRVWVKGPEPKSDEEKRMLARWKAAHPDIPEGATGYYFAPVTEDRSSRPDAPVRTIGMRRGMEYLNGLMQMEQWANDPAVAADIDAGLGQWDPQRFLSARAAAGGKTQTKYHSLPADGALVVETTDQHGRPLRREVIQSPTSKKPSPETEAARLALLTSQAAAAAALTGLRDRTDPNRGAGTKTRAQEARERLGLLTQERITIQNRVANLVKEMEYATGPRRKEIPDELKAARQREDALAAKIQALQRDADAPDAAPAAPAPAAAPAAAPPAPGLNAPRERPPLSSFMR